MGRLDGKIILVTGGARGQGAEAAKRYRLEGAEVVITDVLDEAGEQTARDTGATYLHHDVRSGDEWAAVVDATMLRHGRIDGLLNNAGIFPLGRLMQTDEELYRRVIDVNQVGVFLGMRTVVPVMVEQRGGSIVNLSSVAGLRGSPLSFAYTASKWAVRGMTRAAAQDLGRHNIRVNSVHPGIIDTPMTAGVIRHEPDGSNRGVPLKRDGTAEDVANLTLFLLSDESSYCTGSEFIVDGGARA